MAGKKAAKTAAKGVKVARKDARPCPACGGDVRPVIMAGFGAKGMRLAGDCAHVNLIR